MVGICRQAMMTMVTIRLNLLMERRQMGRIVVCIILDPLPHNRWVSEKYSEIYSEKYSAIYSEIFSEKYFVI